MHESQTGGKSSRRPPLKLTSFNTNKPMTSLPTTYRAAIVSAPGADFEVVSLPLRAVTGSECLVKVYASGICYSDRAVHSLSSSYPRVPGHEVIGRVVQHGPDVPDAERLRLPLGGLVGAGWLAGSCSACEACRANDMFACARVAAHGSAKDGGHAEYFYALPEGLISIPEDVLDKLSYAELAPLLCAGVSAYDALLACEWRPGDIVGVHGIGGLRHLAIQFATKMGLQVHAISSGPEKQDLAIAMGAVGSVDASADDVAVYFQNLGGAQVILSTAPTAGSMSGLLARALRRAGTLMLVGLPYGGSQADTVSVPGTLLVVNRLNIRGWVPACPANYEACVRFAVHAGIKPRVECCALQDIRSAFDRLLQQRPGLRNVITFAA